MLAETQKQVLKKVVSILQENNIQFQITGGLAAIFYGVSRPLYDIDIDVYKKDMQKVRELFKDSVAVDLYHLEDKKFDMQLLTLQIDDVPVDISQVEDAYIFDKYGKRVQMQTDLSKAETIDWEGIKLPVQNKQELIAYKKILNRDVDLIDINQIG